MEAPPPPPPPLFNYADVEAMQNAEGVFVANLLCYSSAEETRFMCWTRRIVPCNSCTRWMLWWFYRTRIKTRRFWWPFII